jgi:UDP-N-acetyl-D-glucosamine dehydrogenase
MTNNHIIAPSNALIDLRHKIQNKTAIIGVIGLGYVGLPFAVEKGKVGFKVIGIEQNHLRALQVNQAGNYIPDVKDEELKQLVDSGYIEAVTNFDRIGEMDAIVICVPTPLTKNLTPNLSYVESITQQIATRLRVGQLITLESTTYPGTTDEIMRPILEKTSGLKQGEDFFLAHSPERVDPGNKRYTTKNINKVVGASDPNSLEVAALFYQQTIDYVVSVSSAKAAELVKVFENTFRAVNIALVNELTLLCDRMGIDVWEVLDAANTKPFGIMPFYPGPGVGGHCIPLDPHYLEWKAKEYNFETHFIALAGEVNRRMPSFVKYKAGRVLNTKGIALSKAKILVIGAGYKKDLGDCRESPAITIINQLLADGSTVSYHDTYVPEIQINDRILTSIELTDRTISEADLIIIATDHSNVNYLNIIEKAEAILDTRGITRKIQCDKTNVTLL